MTGSSDGSTQGRAAVTPFLEKCLKTEIMFSPTKKRRMINSGQATQEQGSSLNVAQKQQSAHAEDTAKADSHHRRRCIENDDLWPVPVGGRRQRDRHKLLTRRKVLVESRACGGVCWVKKKGQGVFRILGGFKEERVALPASRGFEPARGLGIFSRFRISSSSMHCSQSTRGVVVLVAHRHSSPKSPQVFPVR
jgi:hypothetical protein